MRVAVLGCGYVGLALCRRLAAAGHDVVGVRRSKRGVERVANAGGRGIRADVTDADALAAVPDVDALVYAASSGGRGPEAARRVYRDGLATVVDAFGARPDPPDRLLYTSSTGVYGDHDGAWVDESTPIDPQTEKTEVLAAAEDVALEAGERAGIDGTVVRLAGLYGPERYRLDRYLTGPVTEGYLNMIHRDDAAGVLAHLLTRDLARGEVVLAVDDEPVSKWTFADWLAEAAGRDSPPKQTVEERLAADDLSPAAKRRLETSKRCSNEGLRARGYPFRFPTFRDGYREPLALLS